MSDEKMSAEEVERFKATIADLSIWAQKLSDASSDAISLRFDLIRALDMPRDVAMDKTASLSEQMFALKQRVLGAIK